MKATANIVGCVVRLVSDTLCSAPIMLAALAIGFLAVNAPVFGQVINEDFELLPNDGAVNDRFGWSIAIDDCIVAVGALWNDDNGIDSGSAYLFDASTGAQLFKILPRDGAADDWFGYSIASDNGIVAVGAPHEQCPDGSAYLFKVPDAGCPANLNGDCAVGAADLAQLLASWGPCDDCPADFNGDGVVGAADLAQLLANWGPCS